jgi:hypothetical protein
MSRGGRRYYIKLDRTTMKRTTSLLLVGLAFCLSATAQTSKARRPALPSGIAAMEGHDSDSLLKNAAIQARMKKLLRSKYDAFMESFETLNPVRKEGNFLFSSGCLIHACTHLESAIAVDLVNQTIHAAIFRQDQKTRYFNEGGTATPAVLKDWAGNLREINNPNAQSKSSAAPPAGTKVEVDRATRLKSMVPANGFIGGESHDSYVIRARQGQILTLSLSWHGEDDNRASFTVGESADFSGAPAKFGNGSHEDTKWTGTVPRTGNYYVYVVAHPSARYTLKARLR